IVSDKEGKPIFDPKKCIYCGDCIRACPTDSWKANRRGWIVRVGGKHGRHPMLAKEVFEFLPDEKVHHFIEKTLEWYKRNGKRRERIGVTIERVGLKKFKKEVIEPFQEA
ncbi:MAG: 4Fe-4S binding protein, partial [Candidatus Brocadiales bacterium]